MSKVLERMTQQVHANKWSELDALDKKFEAIENKHGYPPKRRYRLFIGGRSVNTLVIEREWESLAAMEAAYEKAMSDPEWQAANMEGSEVIADAQIELLLPI